MVFLFDNHGQRVKLGHVDACPAPTRAVPILIPSAPAIAHEEHFPDIPRPKESFEKNSRFKGPYRELRLAVGKRELLE